MKYAFCVTETLQRIVEIEAESEADAKKRINKQYKSCQITLDANDYKTTQIELVK